MGVPSFNKKKAKKEKKSGVLIGKIEKKKEKFNKKPFKGVGEAATKLDKGKKSNNFSTPDKEEHATSSLPASKKVKNSQLITKNEGFSTNAKLEKKDKLNMVKKAKNPDKVPEAVTNIKSHKKDKKKKLKKEEKAAKTEIATDKANEPQVKKGEKIKAPKTAEQEKKIQARRIEKLQAWQATLDFVLKQKLPKDQVELIKKSKSYIKLPLWKKNYISWVQTDPKYQDKKHGPLIKAVYKVLKGAERKMHRNKKKGGLQSMPQSPKTQAAIDRCVQMATSQEADSPVIKKEIKVENMTNEVIAKGKKAGKDKNVFKQKKQIENQGNVINKGIGKQGKAGKNKNMMQQKNEMKRFNGNSVGKNKAKFMKKAK